MTLIYMCVHSENHWTAGKLVEELTHIHILVLHNTWENGENAPDNVKVVAMNFTGSKLLSIFFTETCEFVLRRDFLKGKIPRTPSSSNLSSLPP